MRERIGPDGVLVPLELDTLPDIDAEAVAVCTLFSFRDPAHEAAIATELRRRLPEAHIVASHEIAPEFREYERASTTAADAYLGPLCARYFRALASRSSAAGLPPPLVMRSSGGVIDAETAAEHPALVLVSGPAAGVVGASLVARQSGIDKAIAFDMGGTSTDVCLITDERRGSDLRAQRGRAPDSAADDRHPHRRRRRRFHRLAGRGRRAAGRPRERRRESRALPATGVAGTRPTVTDANLLLGRLPATLAGGLELDRTAAEAALGDLDAADVIEIVNAEMLRALRVVSVERGHDPAEFALVAYGGAGPLHACALAEELGIETVLVPGAAGVLSALGLVASDERRDAVTAYVCPLDEAGELPAEGEADLRYRGQSFELTVPLGPDLAERFHRAHDERYGVADRERQVELVAVRTAEVRRGPQIAWPAGEPLRVEGPEALELDGATCWIPPGWVGARDGTTIRLTRL